MVLYKYRITWQKNETGDVKFTTVVMKDFVNLDEVERVLDIYRMLSEHPSYKKLKILKIEEIE
ncbi:MAG: hypothetical protein QXK93_06780 [Candidatus Bathyarchaeia archaeon]